MIQKTFTALARFALLVILATTLATTFSSCKTQTLTTGTAAYEPQKPKPISMILDSDFGSSTDDLFALMMLHHYIDDGLVDLKGVVVDREGEKNAQLVDIFNTYYGHPNIPVGLERNGVKNPRCFIPYNGICDLKDKQGNPLFRRTLTDKTFPDGYKLYRQLLSKADDHSVVIVAIGFVTTLAELFQSGPDEYSSMSGLDLFAKKVKSVYIQSGRFESGDSLSGYNMRAASRQSAIFYDKLPKNVDIVMSPSNIGDMMDYAPQDVLVDLSYTEVNPIKSVYTNYTCDTGQRMWDTNCLVNAVLGDGEYNMSPRGWVTFVDRGEESLMLFKQDPNGNARYQMPGDTYFAESKLMDIRRHTRMNNHPAPFTIEAPQPQLIKEAAVQWALPRLDQLVDKYMGSAGNTLDPDDVRMLFRPLGYTGPNALDYEQAEQLVTDAIFDKMVQKALRNGKNDLVIVTGPPASGKSTAVRQLNLKKAGLIYDANLIGENTLSNVIERAKKAGMQKVTVVPVYNDVLTSYKNSINRGQRTWRFTALDYMVASFRDNIGKLEKIRTAYPDVEILPVDCSNNQGVHRVSIEEALKWDYSVTDDELHTLFAYLLEQINGNEIEAGSIPAATGDVLSIATGSETNRALARQIQQRVDDIMHEYKMR
ncbi:MAG: nucleoside hydrolase [Muribaculaceae bacterium]|nr:nucleoside hydrolase [Muribaculaceae bacterium]